MNILKTTELHALKEFRATSAQNTQTPNGIQESVFKGKVRGGHLGMRSQVGLRKHHYEQS